MQTLQIPTYTPTLLGPENNNRLDTFVCSSQNKMTNFESNK